MNVAACPISSFSLFNASCTSCIVSCFKCADSIGFCPAPTADSTGPCGLGGSCAQNSLRLVCIHPSASNGPDFASCTVEKKKPRLESRQLLLACYTCISTTFAHRWKSLSFWRGPLQWASCWKSNPRPSTNFAKKAPPTLGYSDCSP